MQGRPGRMSQSPFGLPQGEREVQSRETGSMLWPEKNQPLADEQWYNKKGVRVESTGVQQGFLERGELEPKPNGSDLEHGGEKHSRWRPLVTSQGC